MGGAIPPNWSSGDDKVAFLILPNAQMVIKPGWKLPTLTWMVTQVCSCRFGCIMMMVLQVMTITFNYKLK